jgi:hypothetical protein
LVEKEIPLALRNACGSLVLRGRRYEDRDRMILCEVGSLAKLCQDRLASRRWQLLETVRLALKREIVTKDIAA